MRSSSGHLHDIGKYPVGKEILFKPDLLDEDERAIMWLHPIHGAEILFDLSYITPTITQIVLIITNDGTERATRRFGR